MELSEEIAARRAGTGDPEALVGEFRRTAVLVPTVGEDQVMSGVHGGVRWIFAFTDEAALARFALARGEATDRPWDYAAILGARLLDVVVPAQNGPAGVAVNVADEDGSMLFPPAPGIVPEAVAVPGPDDGEDV
ncbi:SseB family protein [Streptomyces qinglanensis]|uniref:SseB protein N-terminal domain-containing protein n=1 Tax=Streptomyces qinglanensis TaxID=943816 RepID=A0A1H9VFP3_9ACTN|nr:SseB family protein [Streptomyces qinglanensis]SES20093.1 SseB protein N-terminal domain-containing protein [Streptomyces qinglanensis]